MYSQSNKLYKNALKHIPGGVNSPVRAFKSVGGTPVFIEKAKGSILTDVDGNEYIDYVSSWGPMILGHAHPKVLTEINKIKKNGISFGAPTVLETNIVLLIKKMVKQIDKVRMVNSGTEACMSAIRLARGFTNRNKIIKFEGCYHGHADSFLIEAGSGAATFGIPNSAGVTQNTAKDTLIAKYNDINSVYKHIETHKNEIAAIIIEPVAGNMGCIPPIKGFLEALREVCTAEKIVLIFDEVMTGFRLAPGGAQEYFNIEADLVTYGKIIGGGMPVGAYAGKNEIMDFVSPVGNVYQAGTLSGNPIAMACGYATLTELYNNKNIYIELFNKTKYLANELHKIFKENNISYHINNVGSMISLFFTNKKVVNFSLAMESDQDIFKQFFHGMLEKGIYLPPSPYETWFISNSLTNRMINETVEAVHEAIKNIRF